MTEGQDIITDAAMVAVRELLEAGNRYGIGIIFEPDGEGGWSVGHVRGTGGGDLASACDLETAARAALRPLGDLHAPGREPGRPVDRLAMTDTPQRCAVTLLPDRRHCKNPVVPGTTYCRQHEREPEPTEQDRLLVLKALAAPGVWSLAPHDICDRIAGRPPGDGRTREHRQWVLRTLTLHSAVIDLRDEGLIHEAVPADGYHACEMRITDAGREYRLARSEVVG